MNNKILLIVTGSISAYKAPSIANALRAEGNEVKVVLTNSALKFITKLSFSAQGFETYTDEDDWNSERVLHIDLQQWADKVIIAPCSANTLAKIANGLANNLATNILRAQNKNKPLFISLAMNTNMYNNEITIKHKLTVKEYFNVLFIEPETKMLACGDVGIGALPNIKEIVLKIKEN